MSAAVRAVFEHAAISSEGMAFSSDQDLQGRAHEVLGGHGRAAFFLGLFDRLVGIDLFVTEGDEGEDGVGDARFLGGGGEGGAGGFPGGGDADFVLQFDDDALGGFFADAFGFGEQAGVAIHDGGFEVRDADAAEDVEGGLRSDAADVVDQQAEEVALGGAHEAEEDVGVFADLEVGEDFEGGADGGQFVVAGKRNGDMIPDSMNIHDDMRGQRLDQRAFEKGDHRAEDTGRVRGGKGKVWHCSEGKAFTAEAQREVGGAQREVEPWRKVSANSASRRGRLAGVLGGLFSLLLMMIGGAEARAAEPKWRVLLEPKSMRREVVWEIPGAQRTVFAPVVVHGEEYLPPPREVVAPFGDIWPEVREQAARAAAVDLATLLPRYSRDRKAVIQYAELVSNRPLVASAVLAPEFLGLFADTLGEKVLLVVPSRFQAFVFPALASNYQDYWPMVFAAYRATPWPVSVEVFEVSKEGLRAVGVYQEP